jgi:hypothetical protein
MNRSEQEHTRIVRAWLDEGTTELSLHVHDAVLLEFPATPQDRPFSSSRRTRVSAFAAVAVSAAAAFIVVLAGPSMVSRGGPGGPGPVVVPSPSGVPSSTTASATMAVPLPMSVGGAIAAGTYRLGPDTGVESLGNGILPALEISIGDGWTLWHDSHSPPGLYKSGAGSIVLYGGQELEIPMPGNYGLTEVESACGAYYSPAPEAFVPATVENVVRYLWADAPGLITDAVMDGRPGKTLITEAETGTGDRCPSDPESPQWDRTRTGVIRSTGYAIQVDDYVVFIGTERWADADPSVQAEFDAFVDAIRFE